MVQKIGKRVSQSIPFRTPRSEDKARTRMSNPKVIDNFFNFWSNELMIHAVADKPGQIFNCDEMGWSGKEASKVKVLAPRIGNVKRLQVLSAAHTTALLCISADGKFVPTCIIYKDSLPHRSYKDGVPGSWLFATSESGYINKEIFLELFKKCFIPHCGRARPVLLVMDNHDSHLSLPLIECARESNIVLVGIPSHTTHILKPLDVHINGPLKEKVNKVCTNLGLVCPGISVSKASFPVVLNHALDQCAPGMLKEAFRLSGLYPVDRQVIKVSDLVPPSFTVAGTSSGTDVSSPTLTTCETCGNYLGWNPLVTRGVIPKQLADVLLPPPMPPATNKSRKIVSSGRVITGDEMLQVLREKEADAERKAKAAEERC